MGFYLLKEKRMAYDPNLDKILKDITVPETGLHVRLVQYGEGEKKIALVNEYGEGKFTTKISRMSPETAVKLAAAIEEVCKET